ncbi:MAG: elongation factor EF-2 [Thermoprotei archaeon]|nr:MAG: elongation factor EF-2 [Thermoprotei archaeon]RLE82995.1 MAG: elongation factor EF-2 [Thermoprotei archaeon]RLF02657.1 MAG: elongation factor EF-2 [Thermoprotei archaeon]
MVRFKQVADIAKIMRNREQVRNIGTLAHVDHGKTTLSDNLLMGAGLLSPKTAGKALALDYVEVEQLRQMTVKAANISLFHEWKGRPYVINLVDTPGHVDFTGHVTRSLRIMDGAIVVVDAVEGVMTQTETVVRQGLEERVRPLLFINKVDRLIKELRLEPREVQERFVQIIKDFNNLIELYGEPGFKEKWKVNPLKGQVAFGSALHKWGLTFTRMREEGIKFSYIVDAYEQGYHEELAKEFPLYATILDMVIEHVPNPVEAQRYRVPKIWHGDLDSEIGRAMLECDPDGPLVIAISKVIADPHAGLVATGRIFSGTIKPGDEVYLINAKTGRKVLQVGLYMGPYREATDFVSAGNIVALLGLDEARAGETVVDMKFKDEMRPFERMRYISEPVVTIAIEPKRSSDLPKLVETLRKMAIEDPTLRVHINQETGEYLISGMGTLHLEIALWDLQQRSKIEVVTSPPIVRYRETVRKEGPVIEGKSPNKHNKLYISVEPLDNITMELLAKGIIYDGQDWRERAKILREEADWDSNDARNIWAIDENLNIIVDRTKGIQHLREIRETIVSGFRWSMEAGPLAQEPVRGLKVILHDAVVHEDPAHRGPAQIMPATKDAIFASFLSARPTLLEPILKIDIKVPAEQLSGALNVLTRRRGKVLNMRQTGMLMHVTGEIPVSETFGLADEMRSSTQGKAFWSTQFSRWAPVPESMLENLVLEIRKRKGLPLRIPKAQEFIRM